MQPKAWIMLRMLIHRFHSGNPEKIFKYLKQEDVRAVLSQDMRSHDVSLLLTQPQKLIQQIHYSWLIAPLGKIANELQPLILAALPTSHSIGLAKATKQEAPRTPISSSMKTFLVNFLYSHLEKNEILPLPFLPVSLLQELVTKSKKELIEIIEFLGLYDLAGEIRHVVDKKLLKSFYACLSASEQQFLRICLHQKERLQAPPLDLDQWQGERVKLKTLLHRRGLLRLSKALSGQHPDFVWHITHTLDTGRGLLIQKNYSEKEIPGITSALITQVNHVINFLKKSTS